jgi:hypothetical protein
MYTHAYPFAAAVNFPHHRGSATALPLAAFGLSAFFFSTVAGIISNDTDEFLLVMSLGAFLMTFVPCFILRTVPISSEYTAVPTSNTRNGRRGASKSKLRDGSRKRDRSSGPDTRYESINASSSASNIRGRSVERFALDGSRKDARSSLDELIPEEAVHANSSHHSLYADVRGLQMFKYVEFYELFMLVGLLTGIGLMTIKYVPSEILLIKLTYIVTLAMMYVSSTQI